MSLLMYDRYGGRHGRYKTHPGRLLELTDPWKRRTVQFRSEWVYDLWLCRLADPVVASIVIRPEPLLYLAHGRRCSALADLAVKRPDSVVYETVLFPGRNASRQMDLHKAAEVHGVRWRTTTVEELKRSAQLIENMDRIRQQLVLWLDHDLARVRQCVLDALTNGVTTREKVKANVWAEFGSSMESQTDVAIYRLFFERKISLDLNRRYDDASVIEGL